MFLEIATTAGALAGAALATHVSTSSIAIVFGLVLMYSAVSGSEHASALGKPAGEKASSTLAEKLRLSGTGGGVGGNR